MASCGGQIGGQDVVSTGLTRCRVKNMEGMTLVKPRLREKNARENMSESCEKRDTSR